VLAAATEHGVLDPTVHDLAVDALVNHWSDDDPRWSLLDGLVTRKPSNPVESG
jgi:orotate phosphoribosyltransferase